MDEKRLDVTLSEKRFSRPAETQGPVDEKGLNVTLFRKAFLPAPRSPWQASRRVFRAVSLAPETSHLGRSCPAAFAKPQVAIFSGSKTLH
jgi:hypothetical protein